MPDLLLSSTSTTLANSTAKSVSTASLGLHLVIALGVVLALIAVVARLAKGRVGAVRRSSAPLAVLGRQTLGKGVQVAIVRAGSDTFLLGVTQHQITRISRFNEMTLPETLTSPDDLPPALAAAATGQRWQSVIRQIQDRTVRRG